MLTGCGTARWRVTLAAWIVVIATVIAAAHCAKSDNTPAPNSSPARGETAVPSIQLSVLYAARRGAVLELKGQTDQGASIMINGDAVPLVQADGSFTCFRVVPDGSSTLTITAQSAAGAVNTIRYVVD